MASTEKVSDRKVREKWKQGDSVQLFSRPISSSGELQAHKWQKGKIVEIFNDSEGEWLSIKYCGGKRKKDVQRFADDVIRPMPKKKKKKTLGARSKSEMAETPEPDRDSLRAKRKARLTSLSSRKSDQSVKSEGAVPKK